MTQFDEAAQAAAEEIVWGVKNDLIITPDTKHDEDVTAVSNCITKHFAEIEAVHKKLCELAVHVERAMNDKYDSPDGTAYEIRECRRLLTDPIIVKEIERSKE